MTNDNQDALRCAQSLTLCVGEGLGDESAAHIRRLVQQIEAKDALLRQALKALPSGNPWWKESACIAIRQHLGGRA